MSDLQFEVEGGIAKLTLNRPEYFNAFSVEMIDLWIDALEAVRDSEEIRVAVVTGNGKAFCSGGDVKSMVKGEGFLYRTPANDEDMTSTALARKNVLWKRVQRIPLLMQEIDKPVIAAMNGLAIGAGLDMALMCDIRIAAKRVKVGEGYIKAGLVPGDGGAYFLPRVTRLDQALEMLWTGDVITAERAREMGLITHVVPDDEFAGFVRQYAERLAKGPQQAIRFTKRAVYQSLRMDLRTSLDMISSVMGIVTELPDHREGLQAIVEKREPNFR